MEYAAWVLAVLVEVGVPLAVLALVLRGGR